MIERKRPERILWLLNHTTLREAEVPLLMKLGFEVFTPKKMPQGHFRSGSVSFEYDKSLSIPHSLLKRMNAFNFYTSPWPTNLSREINRYFSGTFCGFRLGQIDYTVKGFTGNIFLRSFGDIDQGQTRSEWIKKYTTEKVINRIRNKNRVWFAPSYGNSPDIEQAFLRRISVVLPIGLPISKYQNGNLWRPENKSIFFVCPDINISGYYKNVYKEFKLNFGDLPHIIAGSQPKPVDDPNVTGFLEQNEFERKLLSCGVMFYHSREGYHLHYHPIEAILFGVPVIYMSGGMLDYLAGSKLPGSCETFDEARQKITRILSGDQEFIRLITASQRVILEEFSDKNVEAAWRREFPLVTHHQSEVIPEVSGNLALPEKKLGIGVWIHETNPKGFVGEGITRLLAQIIGGIQKRGDIEIKIACVSWVKNSISDFFDDLGVASESLDFIVVDDRPPLVLRLYETWLAYKNKRRIKKPSWFHRMFDALKLFAVEFLKTVLRQRNLVGLVLGFLLSVIFAPAILFFLVARVLIGVLERFLQKVRLSRIWSTAVERTGQLAERLGRLSYHSLALGEFEALAKKANKTSEVDVWFLPFPLNEQIEKLNKPVVVSVPDIVYLDAPSPFAKELGDLVAAHPKIERTIRRARRVVTYSDYVKNNHVVKKGYKTSELVRVIPHAPISTREAIDPRGTSNRYQLQLRSKAIIKGYLQRFDILNTNQTATYLQALPFGDFDYLFLPSQSRPHKNMLNMIKAYERLLRERYLNAKLILTGSLSKEVLNYISEKELEKDVLSLRQLPPRLHAALYACAKLTISPSLFEGGFPFVFSESLSVDTPVLLSDIPVVREMIRDADRKKICFDPYSIDSMVSKIFWAWENLDDLLEAERRIYVSLKSRTWEDVGNEYVDTFLGGATSLPLREEIEAKRANVGIKTRQWGDELAQGREWNAQLEKIAYIHVPKTGGTSFSAILDSYYGNSHRIVSEQQLTGSERIQHIHSKVISGHFPYEVYKFLRSEYPLVSFLRDPISRSISQFNQSKNYPYHWALPGIRDFSLEEYLQDEYLRTEISNVQTWMLGLKISNRIGEIQDLLNPRELPPRVMDAISRSVNPIVWTLGLFIGIPQEAMWANDDHADLDANRSVSLSLAKTRLASMPFFGLTERYTDSVNLFSFAFNLPPQIQIPRLRKAVTSEKKKIAEASLLELHALNSLDIKLYEYAKTLFEARYNQMEVELRDKYPKFNGQPIETLLRWNFLENYRG